jgi:hypothetical protein
LLQVFRKECEKEGFGSSDSSKTRGNLSPALRGWKLGETRRRSGRPARPKRSNRAYNTFTVRRNHMNRLQELRDLLNTFEKDFVKFYEKGNKSAGTRVRKHMNELKRKAQEIRKEIQEIKGKTKDEASQEAQQS